MSEPVSLAEGDSLLRIAEVITRTSLSRATIYRMVGRGTFPRQVQISEGCVGWLRSEVNEWITSRARVAGRKNVGAELGASAKDAA